MRLSDNDVIWKLLYQDIRQTPARHSLDKHKTLPRQKGDTHSRQLIPISLNGLIKEAFTIDTLKRHKIDSRQTQERKTDMQQTDTRLTVARH